MPAEARETVHEIEAENAALKAAERIAEVQAEAVVEQAKQLAETCLVFVAGRAEGAYIRLRRDDQPRAAWMIRAAPIHSCRCSACFCLVSAVGWAPK